MSILETVDLILAAWIGGAFSLAFLLVGSIWIRQELARRGQRDELPEDWMSQVVIFRDPLQDNPAAWGRASCQTQSRRA
jgi:hypothetical protein